jgi:hypothetical protein
MAHAPSMAAALWGMDAEDNSSLEVVYFIDDVGNMNTPLPQFNEIVGHEPKFDIRGFSVLDDDRSARFLAQIPVSTKHIPLPTPSKNMQGLSGNLILQRANRQMRRQYANLARSSKHCAAYYSSIGNWRPAHCAERPIP